MIIFVYFLHYTVLYALSKIAHGHKGIFKATLLYIVFLFGLYFLSRDISPVAAQLTGSDLLLGTVWAGIKLYAFFYILDRVQNTIFSWLAVFIIGGLLIVIF